MVDREGEGEGERGARLDANQSRLPQPSPFRFCDSLPEARPILVSQERALGQISLHKRVDPGDDIDCLSHFLITSLCGIVTLTSFLPPDQTVTVFVYIVHKAAFLKPSISFRIAIFVFHPILRSNNPQSFRIIHATRPTPEFQTWRHQARQQRLPQSPEIRDRSEETGEEEEEEAVVNRPPPNRLYKMAQQAEEPSVVN